MKKIIHFSDLHIGYKNMETVFQDIVINLIDKYQPASDYIIVITGDIVNKATKPKSYKKAKILINHLRKAGFTVLIVPGNHDYGNGIKSNKKYVSKFKKYFYVRKVRNYPKLDIIENIAFFGLDSMEKELHWYDCLFAQGELGNKQLDRLKALLNTDVVKQCDYRVIYLHHHPLDPRSPDNMNGIDAILYLIDADKLKETIENENISALLFGHKHDGHDWSGEWGIKRVYDAGTSTRKKNNPSPHRVIELDKDISHDYDAKL